MNVNFYLKDGKATREVLIYCLITYQNKRVKYYTNRKVHPKHWNPESHQFRKSHPNSTALNNCVSTPYFKQFYLEHNHF